MDTEGDAGRWTANGRLELHGELWLSATQAAEGGVYSWGCAPEVRVRVPPGVAEGTQLCLRGQGQSPSLLRRICSWNASRGDLRLRVRTFLETVAPRIPDVEELSTEALAAEAWIYRNLDELRRMLGPRIPASEPSALEVAARFNAAGWSGVGQLLLDHLRLRHAEILLTASGELSLPGQCRTDAREEDGVVNKRYEIRVQEAMVQEPFLVTAVLAHELCHVIKSEWLTPKAPGEPGLESDERARLEEERTVDLLVFMYGLGEFQVRAAEENRFTLGYFDQQNFLRMLCRAKRRRV